jgi:D-cysteine desulfhydrase
MHALFERYPKLAARIPFRALGEFPTPVRPMPALAAAVGAGELYLKDDGLSAKVYGGNKVRKLEFLLADALRAGSRSVLTFGYAGSNHAAATAVYAREAGLDPISMLLPQANASYVRTNLLVSLAVGTEIHEFRNPAALATAAALRLARARLSGRAPYVVPPGGSSALGTLGYVNAAFELDAQIASGEVPEPERIYIALGSSGSAAGLLLGLAVLGRNTRVVAVRVAGERWASERVIRIVFDRALGLLRDCDPSFPAIPFPAAALEVSHGYFGSGYARFTDEGAEARRLARTHEALTLDGSYTAKTLAALLGDVRSGRLRAPVLFWNTYNARDLSALTARADPMNLPARLQRYFSRPVQPLDAGA